MRRWIKAGWDFLWFVGRYDPWGLGRMGPRYAWHVAKILNHLE